ncbi:SAM-dependent methyltransferase [Streptomyces sp. HK10]|uniref:SAM-dependent methyltransferase n=1 Tax=Streptomyces sp. HK10 TaxID=3373255 RepID=UPI003747D767
MNRQPNDFARPSVARVFDHLLGGSDNYAADRALAQRLAQIAPELPDMIRINADHGPRAVATLASDLGIRQYLDLGCGLPAGLYGHRTPHEVARAVHGTARVVYVDSDPVVYGHANMVLAEEPGTAALRADIREMNALLSAPAVQALNRSEPIGVLLHDVLPWVTDDEALTVLETLRAWLPAGSAISLTHATADAAPQVMRDLTSCYAEAGITYRPRSRHHIRALLDPWAPTPPGIVPIPQWRAAEHLRHLPATGHAHAHAAVVRERTRAPDEPRGASTERSQPAAP